MWRGGRDTSSTEIHHFRTCNQFTWSSPSCVVFLQLPHAGGSLTTHYKGCISIKHLSILLAKQSLRASKMATRNTSSSDALMGLSPAYLPCDWSPVATPVLLLVGARCHSTDSALTTSWRTPKEIGSSRKVERANYHFFCSCIKSYKTARLIVG